MYSLRIFAVWSCLVMWTFFPACLPNCSTFCRPKVILFAVSVPQTKGYFRWIHILHLPYYLRTYGKEGRGLFWFWSREVHKLLKSVIEAHNLWYLIAIMRQSIAILHFLVRCLELSVPFLLCTFFSSLVNPMVVVGPFPTHDHRGKDWTVGWLSLNHFNWVLVRFNASPWNSVVSYLWAIFFVTW